MTFKPIYQEVLKKMQEEGRVITLSQEETYRLDNQFAMGLAPIKEEFYRKSRASISYINQLELTTAEV